MTAAAVSPPPVPMPLSTLIGREAEVEHAIRLLRADRIRLLTLSGPGGVGKSRLALAVADQAARAFLGGMWFVPLADVQDPSLVISAVAQAIDVREADAGELLERIARRLAERDTLLVLDNLEQVIDVGPTLSHLLVACPQLKILATSRASLAVRGEQELPVEPLASDAAIELFVQRASQVRPGFTLTDENTGTVAEIVQRLDGLPLAIELAAARITVLSLSALLTRLDHALAVLTTGPRDLPARQRTLAAAIAWSYDLLDESERRLFARLGVFAGGFTLEAAEALGGADGEAARRPESERGRLAASPPGSPAGFVLDRLGSLVDKNLIFRLDAPSGDRFRMLETVRAYALDRLEGSGEIAEVRRAHAEYLLGFVGEVEAAGRKAADRVARLDAERDNVRAALRWALDGGDPALGIALIGRLWRFWYLRGMWSEGRAWLEEALTYKGEEVAVERPALLHGSGALSFALGDYEMAERCLDEALGWAREAGDARRRAAILTSYANLERERGAIGAAEARLREALNLHRALGDDEATARALSDLGVLARRRGDVTGAADLLDQALRIQRQSGDREGLSKTLHGIASARFHLGDRDAARVALEEARLIHRELGARSNEAYALNNLANLAAGADEAAAEIAYYEEALAIFREIGETAGEGLVQVNLAGALWNAGDRPRAYEAATASLTTNRPLGRPLLLALGLWAMADHAAASGAWELAARLHDAGEALLAASDEVVSNEDRQTHDATLEVIWRQLGPERAEALIQSGRQLALDDAIAEALTAPKPTPRRASGNPTPETISPVAPIHDLSPRELDVLRLVARGLSNKKIAEELSISHRTATTHVANILGKLDVESRSAATAYALRHRII